MVCGVRCSNGLPRRTGRGDRGLVCGLSRCRMSSQGSLHRNTRLGFSVGPRTRNVKRVLRANVIALSGEQMQHSFGTAHSPSSKVGVVYPFQWATAVNGNKSSVSHAMSSCSPNVVALTTNRKMRRAHAHVSPGSARSACSTTSVIGVPSRVVVPAVPWLEERHVVSRKQFNRPLAGVVLHRACDQPEPDAVVHRGERSHADPSEGRVPE